MQAPRSGSMEGAMVVVPLRAIAEMDPGRNRQNPMDRELTECLVVEGRAGRRRRAAKTCWESSVLGAGAGADGRSGRSAWHPLRLRGCTHVR